MKGSRKKTNSKGTVHINKHEHVNMSELAEKLLWSLSADKKTNTNKKNKRKIAIK